MEATKRSSLFKILLERYYLLESELETKIKKEVYKVTVTFPNYVFKYAL